MADRGDVGGPQPERSDAGDGDIGGAATDARLGDVGGSGGIPLSEGDVGGLGGAEDKCLQRDEKHSGLGVGSSFWRTGISLFQG